MSDLIIAQEEYVHLNDEQKEFISHIENTSSFPFFLMGSTENFSYLGHITRGRNGDFYSDKEGIINSDACGIAESIFVDFCNRNNIKITKILRSAINLITYEGVEYGDIHVDHFIPHKVFIYYINEVDNGNTYLFNEDNTLNTVVHQKAGKGFIFNGAPHAAGFPNPKQKRKILIVSFI
jgi:hypothetical protein